MDEKKQQEDASLEKRMNEWAESRFLSESELDDILEQKNLPQGKKYSLGKLLSLAAILLICTISWWQLSKADEAISWQDVHEEVAANHRKKLPSEFPVSSLTEAQLTMKRLDFSLQGKENSWLEKSDILGARYCSINGNIAAQFRIRFHGDSAVRTLYAVRFHSAFQNMDHRTSLLEDSEIRSMISDSLLWVIAKDK